MRVMNVAADTRAAKLAGAIAGSLREAPAVELQAIGAAAINQAMKAIATARGFLAGDGTDLVCVPRFVGVAIDGEGKTGLRIEVRPVPIVPAA